MTIAVFIIFMATLALVDGFDCLDEQYKYPNEQFLCKHILQRIIPVKTDLTAWTTYLREYGLCYDNTRITQSFMSKRTFNKKAFCQRNTCERSLCTSETTVTQYTVSVSFINNNNCRATRVATDNLYVLVGCKKVGNRCRPVHFHGTKEKMPNWNDPPC